MSPLFSFKHHYYLQKSLIRPSTFGRPKRGFLWGNMTFFTFWPHCPILTHENLREFEKVLFVRKFSSFLRQKWLFCEEISKMWFLSFQTVILSTLDRRSFCEWFLRLFLSHGLLRPCPESQVVPPVTRSSLLLPSRFHLNKPLLVAEGHQRGASSVVPPSGTPLWTPP